MTQEPMKTEISVLAPFQDSETYAIRIARGSRIATAFLTPGEVAQLVAALSRKNVLFGEMLMRIEVEKK